MARYEVDPDGTFYRIEENDDGSVDRVEIGSDEVLLRLDPAQNPVSQLIADFFHDGLIDRSTGEALDPSDPADQQAFADHVLTPIVRALERRHEEGLIDGVDMVERLHQMLGDDSRIIWIFVHRVVPRNFDARDLADGIWANRAAGIVGSLNPDTPTEPKADDPVETSKPGFRIPASDNVGDTGNGGASTDTGSSNLHDSTLGGDPVRLATGELVHEVVDVRLRGRGLHLAFKRTYRTQVLYKGPLGYNWDHAYNLWLREERHVDGAGGLVEVVVRSTGGLRSDVFTRRLDPSLDTDTPLEGALEAVFDPPAGTFDRLEKRGGFYRLTTPMGTRFDYNERGMCQRIVDLNDNTVDLVYDAEGRLVLVRDPVGKTLEFAYDPAGRIEWLVDTVGDRRWRYSYDDTGDLVEVDSWAEPGQVGTTDYRYTGPDVPLEIQHSLTEVIDATGTTVLFNEYGLEPGGGAFNKVVRQRTGGGEWHYEYLRVSEPTAGPDDAPIHGWTIVTGPGGQRVAHGVNSRGQVVRREEQIAEGGPVRTLIATYRYDEWGLLRSEALADGSRTDYEYAGHRLRETLGPDALFDPDQRARAGDLVRTVRHPLPGSGDERRLVLDYEYAERSQVGGARRIRRVRGPYFADATLAALPNQTVREAHYECDGRGNLLAVRYPPVARPDGSTLTPLGTHYRYHGTPGMPTEIETADLLARFTYSAIERRSGFVTQVVEDPDGLARSTSYDVDDLGRVVRLVESSGAVIETKWNGHDQPAKMLLPLATPGVAPADRTFSYDVLRRPVRVRENRRMPDGAELPGSSRVEERRFDAEGRLTWRSVRNDLDDVLEHEETIFDAAGRAVRHRDSSGVVSYYDYSSRGLVLAVERGRGTAAASRRRIDYDDGGRPIAATDGRGARTRHDYDGFGRLATTGDADGVEIRSERDAEGRVTRRSVWDTAVSPAVRWSEVRYLYDGLGRVIEATELLFEPGSDDEKPFATRFFYDAAGHLERVERPDGSSDRFGFDVLGRLVHQETADGRTIGIEHDDSAREVRTTTQHVGVDADGAPLSQLTRTVQRMDSRGLPIETVDTAGNVERRSYDSAGDLVELIDPGGGRSVWVRDALGRTIEHHRPLDNGEAVTRFTYDTMRRIVALDDPNGDRTLFEHDTLGRVVATIRPDRARHVTTWDAEGNSIEERDETGTLARREYTAGGRLARLSVDTSDAQPTAQVLPLGEVQLTWSPLGQVLSAENNIATVRRAYNSLGLPRWEEIDGLRVETEWDDGGRLRRLRWPDGRTVRYDRRPGGILDAVVDENPGANYPGGRTDARPATLLRARRVGNRATGLKLGPLDVRLSHDARRLPVAAVWTIAGVPVHDERRLYGPRGEVILSESGDRRRHWRFNPALRLVAWQDELGAAPTEVAGLAPPSDASGLDFLGQERGRALTPPAAADPDRRVTYTLDADDNRLEELVDVGGMSEASTYSVGVADRYEQVGERELTHDAAGRRQTDGTLSLTYDGMGRVARAVRGGLRSELSYDALGRLHRLAGPHGAAVRLHYLGDQVVEWREEGTSAPAGHIVPARGRALHVATGGRDLTPIHDLAGDLVAWANDLDVIGRRTYGPFGQVLTSSGEWPVPIGYNGMREDPTGLLLYPERGYDPSTGRFVQPDPARFVDSTNLYSLARHAPGARHDPTGLASIDVDWGSIADEAGATFHSVGDFVGGWMAQGRQTLGLMAGMGYLSLAFPPAWLAVGGYLGWSMLSAEYEALGGGAWGVFGAVNTLNPVYMLLRSGHSTTTAFEDGDYRKAGQSSFDTVFTALTSAAGAKATAPGMPGRLAAARQRLTSGLGEIRNSARARFSTRFWENLAEAPPLTEEQYLNPTPGDPILLSPYEGGLIRFDAELAVNLPKESWLRLMREHGKELGARSLGQRGWVVTQEAVDHYVASGKTDMSRIIAQEMPFIEQASHIYFFVTRDMHKRPITLREFEIVMDDPKLRPKTTFIPRD